MPSYSLAEAKNRLAAMVDEALAGGTVMIAIEGRGEIELRPTHVATERETPSRILDEIAERSRRLPALNQNLAEIVRDMRDDDP